MKMKDIKTLISSGVIIIAVALYLIFADDPKDILPSTTSNEDVVTDQTEQVILLNESEQKTGNKAQTVEFISANDGDTINVKLDGEKKRVRLLMVDTPEMNYDKGEPMPFAEEAKNFTTSILSNSSDIQLLFDKGPKTDKYDRLLAYIFVDGVSLQELLLQEGYAAVVYVNKPNNTLEEEFLEIQKVAEESNANVWSLEGYFENNHFVKSYIEN